MSVAGFCIERKVLTYALTLALLLAGMYAYRHIGRLEDPEFTIKTAQIITSYPGASALDVMNEVTDPIEIAVQQLGQIKRVTSVSSPGRSVVSVDIQDHYGAKELPQVWDELRRKVRDMQGQLPQGAREPIIFDDFGDVYGVFYAIYGDGYTYADLRDYAKVLRRELLLCEDVAKIALVGEQPEVVYLEIGRTKLANTGISIRQLQQVITGQNTAADAGHIEIGDRMIRVYPTGKLDSVEALGDLLLIKPGPDQPAVRLRDIADIRRDYLDPPRALMRYNGHPSIGLGISTVRGGNVITMGKAVDQRLEELKAETPIGIEFGVISHQADSVNVAVRGFVVNLILAVVIVIAVLLVAMGMRSGVLIGAVLVVTVMGTVFVMEGLGLMFERVSLGAFIIALGMLVDNAIVITDGVLVAAQRGEDRVKAALATVKQTQWPLLGATAVAILSFAPIGASQDLTGEYCRSLFIVLLVSLLLSWLLAITVTPLLAAQFLRGKGTSGEGRDPYAGPFYRWYRAFLIRCLRFRWVSVAVLLGLLAAAIYGFGYIQQSFFPDSTRPQFMVHVWMPAGTSIHATDERVRLLADEVRDWPGVTAVTEMTGTGGLRFLLTYSPETPDPAFGLLLVDVEDDALIDGLAEQVNAFAVEATPDAMVYAQRFVLGPGDPQKIQVRISGPDPAVLRQYADIALEVLRDDPRLVEIQTNWRDRVDVLRPVVSEARARAIGVSRMEIAAGFQAVTTGLPISAFKEGDDTLPVILRAPPQERSDPDSLYSAWFWSVPLNQPVPLAQVIDRFENVSEEANLHRRNRLPTITVKCNTTGETASSAFQRIRPLLSEALADMPDGYRMAWGGEYESSGDAQSELLAKMPPILAGMVLIVVALFNSIRKPLVIFLTVPLTVVGVTIGLLVFNQPFGFMALLGFLSLAGMQIKNAIVLIDEIEAQQAAGADPFNAVVQAGMTRLRPVVLAALTTVLGMMPLLLDAFYVSMAITIMIGLSFATVLTMIVIPLNYAIWYRVRE